MIFLKNITFPEYMKIILLSSKDRENYSYSAYTKITSYILKTDNINIVTDIKNPDLLINLIHKYEADKSFMSDNLIMRNKCIFCLYKYLEYINYLSSQKLRKG